MSRTGKSAETDKRLPVTKRLETGGMTNGYTFLGEGE